LTGPQHSAAELHGYLAYIVACSVNKTPYKIFGYKGKQVRHQIHSYDVVTLFLEFYENPTMGEVYNLGGGRQNSLSILETISMLKELGLALSYEYVDTNRIGDHICYISGGITVSFLGHQTKERGSALLPSIIEKLVASASNINILAHDGGEESEVSNQLRRLADQNPRVSLVHKAADQHSRSNY